MITLKSLISKKEEKGVVNESIIHSFSLLIVTPMFAFMMPAVGLLRMVAAPVNRVADPGTVFFGKARSQFKYELPEQKIPKVD